MQNVTVERPAQICGRCQRVWSIGRRGLGSSVNFSRANVRPETHATIGKSNVFASGEVRVTAVPTIDAEVTGTGVAVGIGAAGIMLANLEVGRGNGIDEVQAGVDDGAKVLAQSVVIEANSIDTLDVQSVAGAGGAFAGTGATSTIKSDQSTLAYLGTGTSDLTTSVVADSFFMQARREQDFDSSADAVTIAFGAGTGAGLENTIAGRSKSLVGKATVDARSIVINANNNIDKDRYGTGDGVNLATVSVSGGSLTGLESKTSIGTVANPSLALVDIKPGAVLRAHGDADNPGILNVDAQNSIDAIDRTYAEEASLSLAITLAISTIDVQARAMINVDGATLENKYGAVNLTSHTDSQTDATSEVTAAALLSAQIASNAVATPVLTRRLIWPMRRWLVKTFESTPARIAASPAISLTIRLLPWGP